MGFNRQKCRLHLIRGRYGKGEIAKGLEIKPDKTLSYGFRIGVKNGAAYYDYSAESLSEMFAAYLNPKVAALIKIAAKDA